MAEGALRITVKETYRDRHTNSNEVMKESYMEKRGGRNPSYKKRFFRLFKEGKIEYYKDEHCNKVQGIITLKGAATKDLEDEHHHHRKEFALVTSEEAQQGRTFFLRTKSESTKVEWMTAINNIIEEYEGEVQRVLTGIAKLIPEWRFETNIGWVVKRIALHIFNAGNTEEHVATYQLDGSLVEADSNNARCFTVHLPGKFRRLVIECPSDEASPRRRSVNDEKSSSGGRLSSAWSMIRYSFSSSFGASGPKLLEEANDEKQQVRTKERKRRKKKPLMLLSRSEWISQIALCSGPPDLVPVGITLRSMLSLLVHRIEREGNGDAGHENTNYLQNMLSEISYAIYISDQCESKRRESIGSSDSQPNKQSKYIVRISMEELGHCTILCRPTDTAERVKLLGITKIVEKRKTGNGLLNKYSLKTENYRLMLVGSEECESVECESSQTLMEIYEINLAQKLAESKPNLVERKPSLQFALEPIKTRSESIVRIFSSSKPKVVDEHFVN
mmetsp:Transcript_6083/g.11205  ORF Transcript_6083/g.11205 Transcript_6083/m.11205 type:complete len:503 (-) Transcript_6083:219-1727(-)